MSKQRPLDLLLTLWFDKKAHQMCTTYLDLYGMIGPFSSKYVLCKPNSLKSFWIYFRNGSPDTDSITADKSV